MAAAWVHLVVLVFCSTTTTLLTTADDGLESPLQGPPDKPSNVRFESVNFNHTLRWDRAPNHDNSTVFTVQYIGARHREPYPSPEDWQEKSRCINITALCCVLLNEIGEDGNWWARVRAFNSYGTSDWEESKVFEPFEDTLIGAPDLDIPQVKTDRIHLRVKAPKTPFYDSNTGRRMRMSNIFTSIRWKITYKEVGSSHEMKKETTDRDVVLRHLYPGKRYCITVHGEYLDMTGESGRICADTMEAVPKSGARALSYSVDCTKYQLRNIRLTWQPPAEEKWNGELQKYKISYRKVGAVSTEMTHSWVPAEVTNFTIRDLSATKEYVVDVAACTSAGCSETPDQHMMMRVPPFKTDTSPSYAPNVSAAPLSPTSMQVSWSPLEDACVQGYMVQFAPGVEPVTVDSGTTMVNLTGLLPGTEYHVCVKARLPSANERESGECHSRLGVYARTETAGDPNILVQTVLPVLAVTVLLVLLCVAVLWMRGSPILSISKINIVLPPVLVEIKETKDSSALEPISSSKSEGEHMDDIGSIRANMIRQKSKFVKSLQNLPDTLSLDDDVFADETRRLLSWKSDKDLVVKVVIPQKKSEDKDEPSSPTSTDSGNVSGPSSLTTDSGGDDEKPNFSVTMYNNDSPVSPQKKNSLESSTDSPRSSQEPGDPQTRPTRWPENQTTSSEIDSYVQATDGTSEDYVDEGFQACKSQSNPYVLAVNLPLLAPPFTQKPNTNPQATAAHPTNPPSQRGVTDLPAPNLFSHLPGANPLPTQSMSSGSSIDPYVVSAAPLRPLPVPRPASNTVDALDSPSSSSTSSVDPYVQAAAGPRGWQNPPASSARSSASMSSESDVDPYIRASSRPSATQRPPGGLHRPRGPQQTRSNLNSSSNTRGSMDYQDPWVAR